MARSAALAICESAATLAVPAAAAQLAAPLFGLRTGISFNVFALVLVLLALQTALRITNAMVSAELGARVLADLRRRVYEHVQALPLAWHQAHRSGDVVALTSHETLQLAGFLTGTVVGLAPTLLTLIGSVAVLVWLDAWLAFAALLCLPPLYLVLKLVGRRLRSIALEVQRASADAQALVSENLASIFAVKAFAREEVEAARYAARVEHLRALNVAYGRVQGIVEPSVQFFLSASVVALLWVGADRIVSSSLTPVQLTAFVLYGALLTRPLAALSNVYGQFQLARGTLQRLEEVLETDPEDYARGTRLFPSQGAAISLRDVVMAYPGRPPVLKGLSCSINAGEIVGLTGPNGAGKSTLGHLLLRFYEPASGQVRIGDADLRDIPLTDIRQGIGLVPQHVQLIAGTIAQNIAYGLNRAAAPEEIESAARLAQAHQFIEELPHGYETEIGEGGSRLSGGQRQRLALARALAKRPSVLILDEPTAMFDPAAEAEFVQAARQGMAGCTVILITHRPASLALADRVLRLEHGLLTPVPV